MYTILTELTLPDCGPIYELLGDLWVFSCGLLISDKLVAQGLRMAPLRHVHEKHHAHMTNGEAWNLVCTTETGDDWIKYTYSCSH